MEQTSSHQAQRQNKQRHNHEAPKITFQKTLDADSLDKQLGKLHVRGKNGKVVESYRKELRSCPNPDTVPPPSFVHVPGNQRAGRRFLKQAIKDKTVNSHLAYHELNNLRLQGKDRKVVENYHREVVGDHMKDTPGSHSAVIKNLAHGIGSVDPKIHVSAKIKDERGDIIKAARHGNAKKMDDTHHIYTNKKNPEDGYAVLPSEYKTALDEKARREGTKPGRA